MKKKLLISVCLLGVSCRYDGKDNRQSDEMIAELTQVFDLVPVCPEQLGGLSTPRLPAEIRGIDRVIRQDGEDVTRQFHAGADAALRIANLTGCRVALLKAHSPSCGTAHIYDGSFSGKRIPGKGISAKLFEKNGIKTYNETEIDNLLRESDHV